MADSVVAFLLQNLSRLLEDELKLLSGVEDKIISLSNELKFIDIFLKSSEGKRNEKVVKEVVNQIRDVAHKAEDIVDTYVANATKHRTRNALSKLFHFKERFMVLHKVHAEIERIKNRIDEIYKNKERYDIGEGVFKNEEATAAAESLRRRRRDVEEEDVVGLVHDSTHVIRHLVEEGDLGRKVFCIIGMGGLGKTTLARKVYNNNMVKELFTSCAWGYVSNDYRASEVLLSLLKCLLSKSEYNDLLKKIADEGGDISEGELKMKVGECLKGNKYLVVLDDIWKTQVWDEVKAAFPDDKNGSRILITSRINEVAHYSGTACPYYLPFLTKDESWELFSKKVFRGEECPSNLKPLGRSIVESCGGLPLAIVVLAGLVAKKEKSEREWKRIMEVSWHLTQDKTEVMDILKLSYDFLPQRLKPCFLYLGIYPEDYEINARQLIQLWIAEGFIHSQETGFPDTAELEDIGDYYLDELVDRSLVQVASRRSDGGVKTCRIHDLLRDLCISESKSCKFFEVCTEANIDTLSFCNPRRLSLQCKARSYISTKKFNQSYTRSLFFFPEIMHTHGIPKSIKCARVLYSKSKGAMNYSLHSGFKTMIHLRYLRIDTGVGHIPASICNLWNLETLDIRYKETVSSEIWKLKRLRHLYLRGGAKLPEVNRERKENLQTLWLRAHDRQMVSMLNKDMFPNDMFPRLRKLVLHYPFHPRSHEQLPTVRLPSLHHLSNLQSLKIIDFLELPPDPNAFPSNLNKITWKQIHIANDFFLMNTLGWLTNLQILKLGRQRSHVFFDLNVGEEEFPQLQVFEMRGMRVRNWRLDKTAMPHLRHLLIESCEYLNDLPEELWSLTTLQEVHAMWPSERLANRLQNVKLKNGCKLIISHTP
ncbi:disease resistance protein RPP13-like [Abrus precatorius]|uniref:Disease resistance protein RPP13-like n=1 Tax=Abrus precatorius TaxID=3816 RepID=A0A8B8L1C9_ABRPR|nr:disease resistance protein RPP13-like [Abrus precatorius]